MIMFPNRCHNSTTSDQFRRTLVPVIRTTPPGCSVGTSDVHNEIESFEYYFWVFGSNVEVYDT